MASVREAFEQSVREGDTERMLAAIGDGADPDGADEAGWRPIHIASSLGSLPVLRALMSTSRVSVNAQTVGGQTALHYAASRGHTGIIEWLTSEFGADLRLLADRQGATALHRAAALGQVGAIQSLVHGFPSAIDRQDADGNTALHLAVIEGHPAAGRLLLELGADPGAMNKEQRRACDYAIDAAMKAVFPK